MNFSGRMFVFISRLSPEGFRRRVKKNLVYAGVSFSLEHWVGMSIFLAVLSSLSGYFLFDIFFPGSPALSVVVAFGLLIVVFLAMDMMLVLLGDSRTNQVEEILPDALMLISANIRAGLTPDRAIWLSARPEFGLLEEEIREVGRETLGGRPLEDALKLLPQKIRSTVLDRTVQLIEQGMRAGGELAQLLEEIARDLRTSQVLKKEIGASVMMYTIFIMFACLVGAPLLFGISTFFVKMSLGMEAKIQSSGAGSMPSGDSGMLSFQSMGDSICATPGCDPLQVITYYAVGSLVVTNFFGALLIGIIQQGKAVRGVRYMPIFIGVSVLVFFIVRMGAERVFGSLMG